MLSYSEFTYCHIRNVIRLAMSDVSFLQVDVFVVLELTLVLWYLSVAAVRQASLFPKNSKPVAMFAIRYTIDLESLPVS